MEIIKKKCPKCGQEIEGTAESQVDYNMGVHIVTQHRKVRKSGQQASTDNPESNTEAKPIKGNCSQSVWSGGSGA
jgi:hypothetical protein